MSLKISTNSWQHFVLLTLLVMEKEKKNFSANKPVRLNYIIEFISKTKPAKSATMHTLVLIFFKHNIAFKVLRSAKMYQKDLHDQHERTFWSPQLLLRLLK